MLFTKDQVSTIHSETFAFIQVEENNHLLTVTLNRPEKKNAMNPTMMREVAYALTYAHYTNAVWAVVLAANGDIFSAGADLKAFAGQTEPDDSTIPQPAGDVVIGDLFRHLHKPCIGKIHAPVMAGGFLLVCGCTHIIASDKATFSLPEVRRGIWPFQVMQSMLQVMPARQVLDFCMRAGKADAQRAKELGLVTEVVAAGELDSAVQSLVDDIFKYSPTAIRKGLEAYDKLAELNDNEKHTYLLKMLGETIGSQDAKEGIKAFMEKREPNWIGE